MAIWEFLRPSRRGFSLLEVLVALLVIAITSGAVTILVTQSARTSNLLQNRIIATNLARNALEALVSWRDTNWLKFADKESCWDVEQEEEVCGAGFGQKVISQNDFNPHYFKLVLNPITLEKLFEKVDQPLDLEKTETVNQTANKKYGLFEREEEPNKGLLIGFPGEVAPSGEPKFYRMIKLQRAEGEANNVIEAAAVVEWKSADKVHKINLERRVINY